MRNRAVPRLTGALAVLLAVALSLSVLILIGIGYRAIQEWRRSEDSLAERRARETVDLVQTALSRDMRGVQRTILSQLWEEVAREPPGDVRTLLASVFARYPYPESFFVWRGVPIGAGVPFFHRSDRPPPWLGSREDEALFPVFVAADLRAGRTIVERIQADARGGRRHSVFERSIGGEPYQIVARLYYRDALAEHLEGVVGFTVNLSWVRQHYFPGVASEVARLGRGLPFSVVDVAGPASGSADAGAGGGRVVRGLFPVLFFDPLLVSVDLPSDLSKRSMAIVVDLERDKALEAATRGANRTVAIAAVAAAMLVAGLMLAVRAARASARLAEMRSDFVSTVTHDLKTPIATIRAIGDTIAHGRVSDPRSMREYAELVVQESKRLTRLIENLLAYARVTDVTEVYAFEPLDLHAVVDDAVEGFRTQLAAARFDVQIDMPADLPAVRADRTAIGMALDNLLDNAIRYSGPARHLSIRARRERDRRLALEVADRGEGIPADQIEQVTRRFFRGRRSEIGGSGLGLAIVSRIVADHGGEMSIESRSGAGTTVRLSLPIAEEQP